jgi:hypothetical protein
MALAKSLRLGIGFSLEEFHYESCCVRSGVIAVGNSLFYMWNGTENYYDGICPGKAATNSFL